jgi:hypothetical protein
METVLINHDIEAEMNAANHYLQEAERFLSSMDEERRTCQICHRRPREFDWSHWGKKPCGWHHLCHPCFLKIKRCPWCKEKVGRN